jgi:hypothetical protein
MTCANCGKSIEPVTMAGVTVWAHSEAPDPPAYCVNSGARLCWTGKGAIAWPEGKDQYRG